METGINILMFRHNCNAFTYTHEKVRINMLCSLVFKKSFLLNCKYYVIVNGNDENDDAISIAAAAAVVNSNTSNFRECKSFVLCPNKEWLNLVLFGVIGRYHHHRQSIDMQKIWMNMILSVGISFEFFVCFQMAFSIDFKLLKLQTPNGFDSFQVLIGIEWE